MDALHEHSVHEFDVDDQWRYEYPINSQFQRLSWNAGAPEPGKGWKVERLDGMETSPQRYRLQT